MNRNDIASKVVTLTYEVEVEYETSNREIEDRIYGVLKVGLPYDAELINVEIEEYGNE